MTGPSLDLPDTVPEVPASIYRDLYAALALIFAGPHRLPPDVDLSGILEDAARRFAEAAGGAWEADEGGDASASPGPDLGAEFGRLFYGPGRPAVPPYESLYSTPFGEVMRGPALQVLQVYARYGFEPREGFHDCPDHLAVELEFLAHLCAAEAAAAARGALHRAAELRSAQREFIRLHLGCWAPEFARRLAAAAPRGLFARARKALEMVLAQELTSVTFATHPQAALPSRAR